MNTPVAVLLAGVVGGTLHWRTLLGSFVWDDRAALVRAPQRDHTESTRSRTDTYPNVIHSYRRVLNLQPAILDLGLMAEMHGSIRRAVPGVVAGEQCRSQVRCPLV